MATKRRPEPPLLLLEDVAARLNLRSTEKVKEWILAGELYGICLPGEEWRVSERHLKTFLAARTVPLDLPWMND
jgi:hypothetical protein